MWKYGLIIITIIIILSRITIFQPTFIIAILGTFGMAIGFTLQNVISNFTSGILINILKPFKKGEHICTGKISGIILNIDIFYTVLRTIDGKITITPNGKIMSENIINYSRTPIRRNKIFIKVSPNSNVKKIISILKKVVENEDKVMKNKEIIIRLQKLSPYYLTFVVRFWSKTEYFQSIYWDLMYKFKKALDKKNIDFSNINKKLMLNKKKYYKYLR
ncbi:MAG: mechanosensitive ion channel [Buchnera aphidicola (Periphyllus lyropictus)]|uniref:mechanosensitive ion channel domain-containing protein n=1 Tax=Buchnera aphidicola TaxID=9 RepID=UPI001EC383D0|nr:mechanosensitive ion channel domain-containing protein [Buchnera aphidicola]NIH16530.1 mechanosensitive ion channel [Buchnera aphidicola (Periphyllus lyropictus)]USS94812.1 mechanosensitive ion channel [Buchnera aphidicola (Periphyllus lyropictus)]